MIGNFNKKPDLLETQINAVLNKMSEVGPDSEEYRKLIVYLDRLNSMKVSNRPHRISGDTMAIVVGNLLGILIIVAYEQKHVMSSRAFGFGMKKAVSPN